MSAINITKTSTTVTTTQIDTPLAAVTVIGPLSEDKDVVRIVVEPRHPDITIEVEDDTISFKIEGVEQISDFVNSLKVALDSIESTIKG